MLSGTVRGVDGKPCTFARIGTKAQSDSMTVVADSLGAFTLMLPQGEPKYLFVADQAGHGCTIPLMTSLDDSVRVEVQLDTLNGGTFWFSPSISRTGIYAHLHTQLSAEYFSFVDALQALQRDNRDTAPLLAAWADSASHLKQMVLVETDPIMRGEYLIRYYRLASIPGLRFDTLFYRSIINEIGAYSPLWFFNNYEAFDQTFVHPAGKRFVDSMVASHPSRELRAFLLFQSAMEAQSSMNQAEVERNYLKLKSQFADVWWAKIADQWLMPLAKLRTGAKVPEFSFKDMDDSTKVYSNATLSGHFYLLDFWATWCLPCIGEIPNIQAAYQKYRDKGLEIISISSDLKKSEVEAFRAHKHAMPWKNVWISPDEIQSVHEKFEVTGIPRPIFVNPDGTIIGIGPELRGDNLDKVLAKYIGP